MLKKKWGQHILINRGVAGDIVDAFLSEASGLDAVLEIGPGRGALTSLLMEKCDLPLYLLEIDPDMRSYLQKHYPLTTDRFIGSDFLTFDAGSFFKGMKVGLIGNFPYNISGPLIFKILEERTVFPLVTGMFQKEVAVRLTIGPGSKEYGIPGVFAALFYSNKYIKTVSPGSFAPPPKVQSGVIVMKSLNTEIEPAREKILVRVVKKAFNQRRKKLKNNLKEELESAGESFYNAWSDYRPEQVPPEVYLELSGILYAGKPDALK